MSKKENANDKMGKWMTGISNMGLAPKPKEGCEFCRGEDVEYFDDYSVQLNDGELLMRCDESYHNGKLKINYCPMCGRKLVK
ncbi:hypothetical protein [Acetobacterium sp.]|uniref:hypothetical protein n=1 Tax=Acetobacterium sp. TaxID=1872094 RepID=UPI00271BD497|nr:hypothetical protein [Acetobacterium sp.]MDO9492827.1 hypothetical protein [Acetobacterium sp.]